MSYAGTVLDMIRRQKMNRDLQKQIKQSYVDRREQIGKAHSELKFNPDFGKDLTEVEKMKRNKAIHDQIRVDTRSVLLKTLFFVVAMVLIIFLLSLAL